jgi:hypothetical protein
VNVETTSPADTAFSGSRTVGAQKPVRLPYLRQPKNTYGVQLASPQAAFVETHRDSLKRGFVKIVLVTTSTSPAMPLQAHELGGFAFVARGSMPEARAGTTKDTADSGSAVWLESLYALSASGKTTAAVRKVFERLEDLLAARRFVELSKIFDDIDETRLQPHVLVAVLRVAYRAREVAPAWYGLRDRVRNEFEASKVDDSRSLLAGLL